MTVTEPIPATEYGKADWVDYSNYWREKDAEWLMQRSILRYADTAGRNAEWPTPNPGHVVYNQATNRLEVASAAGGWATVQQFVNLLTTQDTAAGVAISHKDAAGKGLVFEPTRVAVSHNLSVLGGVLTADATGVTIKTGAKTAKLATDATSLVSDSPISAPSLFTPSLSATAGTVTTLSTTNLSVGGTLTGGVINGSSGTIGGVVHSANRLTASDGLQVNGGSFYGDGASALMRPASRTGPYVQATTGAVVIAGGGNLEVYNQMRVWGGQAIHYIRSDGVHTGYIAPSFWGGDPGVGNVPEGSIWIS